jgi:toxin secretion/phage lysis holin
LPILLKKVGVVTDTIKFIKGAIAAMGAYISTKLGILGPWLLIYLGAMTVDYVTGMLSAAYRGLSSPEEGLNSRIGIKGILKKIGYCILVVVAIMLDWVIINSTPYIGLDLIKFKGWIAIIIMIWLFINECISILENLAKMNLNIPQFLLSILKTAKNRIEEDNQGGMNNVTNTEKTN